MPHDQELCSCAARLRLIITLAVTLSPVFLLNLGGKIKDVNIPEGRISTVATLNTAYDWVPRTISFS